MIGRRKQGALLQLVGAQCILGRVANTQNVDGRPIDGEQHAETVLLATVDQATKIDPKISRFVSGGVTLWVGFQLAHHLG
jgi:hypothetical protein